MKAQAVLCELEQSEGWLAVANGLDLGAVDFGDDNADQDATLDTCFFETDAYREALAERRSVILGAKGSGKSAVRRMLMARYQSENLHMALVTTSGFSWSFAKAVASLGVPSEKAMAVAWLHTLLSAAVHAAGSKGVLVAGKRVRRHYRFLSDGYDQAEHDRRRRWMRRAENAVRSIETLWVRFRPTDWKSTNLVSQVERAMLDMQHAWPHGLKMWLLVDELDDVWRADDESRARMSGVLVALSEIQKAFGESLRVVVFMRDDIYDSLRTHHKDRIHGSVIRIGWREEDLVTQACERVRSSCGLELGDDDIWEQLFETETIQGRKTKTYILNRTFMRPRHVLAFMRACQREAVRRDSNAISAEDVRRAERDGYSLYCYERVVADHSAELPDTERLLGLFTGRNSAMTRGELVVILSEFSSERTPGITVEQLVDKLFRWGVIGVKHGGRYRFSFDPDLPGITPFSHDEFSIHAGLRDQLGVS